MALQQMINSVIKKFEIFDEFFEYDEGDIDFKTRLDDYEIDDITFLHTLHDFWKDNYKYDSPLFRYLERKKRLKVSKDGLGRREMENILRENTNEDKPKTSWERLTG